MSPAEKERYPRFLRALTAHEPAIRAFIRRLVPTRARRAEPIDAHPRGERELRASRSPRWAFGGSRRSHRPVLPEQGRWVHLATVYDSEKRTVRFYLNRHAQIGNWDCKDRRLSGRVHELLLPSRAMNDDEVRALYVAGNPYR